MNITVLYHKKNALSLQKTFGTLMKSKKYSIEFIDRDEYNKPKKTTANSLYYLDITGLQQADIQKYIKYFNKESMFYGIIDYKNTFSDIAWFFHNNACDYITKETCNNPISESRIRAIVTFKSITLSETPQKKYIIARDSWKSIKPEQEYTFCFLLIEILDVHELKKHIASEHLDSKIFSFRHFVENTLNQLDGKLWMWMDATGLFIFPFDGKSLPAVDSAIRLTVNRSIISLEHTLFNQIIHYRIAMHIGNTVYQPHGKTGTIISDCINSLFHLGQKYTADEGLFITEDVYNVLNSRTKGMFIQTHLFEGRQIYRCKNII